jgi:hypothetical protein
LYGSLVVNSNKGCVTSGKYHGGTNMHDSGVGHPNDPTCELNGGPLGGFHLGELLPNEFPSCPPFDG